jgi:hypothetical protein
MTLGWRTQPLTAITWRCGCRAKGERDAVVAPEPAVADEADEEREGVEGGG